MKNITFDIISILIMGGLLLILNQLGILEKYAKFSMIPFLVFYFLGKYSERKIQKKNH